MLANQYFDYETPQHKLGLIHPIANELNGSDEDGLESVKLIDHPSSYNYSVLNHRRIYVVGEGPRSGPGKPSTHQSELRQKMVLKSYKTYKTIHVFHETKDHTITYLGPYYVNSISRKITHAGWVYSQVELLEK